MFFKKKKEDDTVVANKSWYEDRYQTVVVQRNFLVILIALSLFGITVSTFAVMEVTSSKRIEPFVIEIEEKTGVTNVIRPLLKEQISADESLRRYFILKYMRAREEYLFSTHQYQYYNVVRLLSNQGVFYGFRTQITSDVPSNFTKLGKGRREIEINSLTRLRTSNGYAGFTYQVRFTATNFHPRYGASDQRFIATIEFEYADLNLTIAERAINPLGFRVTGYIVEEDNI